eukprot:542619_1
MATCRNRISTERSQTPKPSSNASIPSRKCHDTRKSGTLTFLWMPRILRTFVFGIQFVLTMWFLANTMKSRSILHSFTCTCHLSQTSYNYHVKPPIHLNISDHNKVLHRLPTRSTLNVKHIIGAVTIACYMDNMMCILYAWCLNDRGYFGAHHTTAIAPDINTTNTIVTSCISNRTCPLWLRIYRTSYRCLMTVSAENQWINSMML